MSNPSPLPSYVELYERLAYDPQTGELTWKSGRSAGGVAGYQRMQGGRPAYVAVNILGKKLSAHRVIWKLFTGQEPPALIDHINRDPFDNRWCNLRAATASQNSANRSPLANTSSRYVGVTKHRKTGLWQAQASHKGRNHYIGLFSDEKAAARARDAVSIRLYGPFAYLNFSEQSEAAHGTR